LAAEAEEIFSARHVVDDQELIDEITVADDLARTVYKKGKAIAPVAAVAG
jgi:hypothetical protein